MDEGFCSSSRLDAISFQGCVVPPHAAVAAVLPAEVGDLHDCPDEDQPSKLRPRRSGGPLVQLKLPRAIGGQIIQARLKHCLINGSKAARGKAGKAIFHLGTRVVSLSVTPCISWRPSFDIAG